jgi:2-C-methyl-D-erythritol 2,4-cyclodiphosphate synthase
MDLLRDVYKMLEAQGFKIVNIDSVIIAQKPKLAPYIEKMRIKIAQCLDIDIYDISIKATTEENMGFTGREEGIRAKVVCLIEKTK